MNSNHILVVDDDRSNCRILSKLLSAQGYRVDWADNGQDAVMLARQHPYGLALLDYRMPDMDGVELYRQLRQIRPEIVGVFQTAFAKIEVIYAAIDAGAERVLAKPVDARELLPLVERLVGKPHSTVESLDEMERAGPEAELTGPEAASMASTGQESGQLLAASEKTSDGDFSGEMECVEMESLLAMYAAAGPEAIASRLRELDEEWSMSQVFRTGAAAAVLAGITLGALFGRKWLALSAAAGGLLLQHSVTGSCLPTEPLLRSRFRPQQQIELERYALKVLRGDFQGLAPSEGDLLSAARRAMHAVSR